MSAATGSGMSGLKGRNMGPRIPLEVRLNRYIEKRESGCWEWVGYRNSRGYGYIMMIGKGNTPAHRVTYEFWVGLIPDGLEIDHLCRNPSCVNPEHLEPVTHAENMARSAPAQQTHCKRGGHPLSGDNLYINATSGARQCRACMGEARARWEEKNADKIAAYRQTERARELSRERNRRYEQRKRERAEHGGEDVLERRLGIVYTRP